MGVVPGHKSTAFIPRESTLARTRRRTFTSVELLVVVGFFAVLIAILCPPSSASAKVRCPRHWCTAPAFLPPNCSVVDRHVPACERRQDVFFAVVARAAAAAVVENGAGIR